MLEGCTLSWNVAGVVVLAVLAVRARSTALSAFGLDSLIEIGASTVVVWELTGADATRPERQARALRLIGLAFGAVAVLITIQALAALLSGPHPHHSTSGIAWTGLTAFVMLLLAAGKSRTGRALQNPVLLAEGRVTLVDAALAISVLVGLVLNASLGWWWADPLAGLVIVGYAVREVLHAFRFDA